MKTLSQTLFIPRKSAPRPSSPFASASASSFLASLFVLACLASDLRPAVAHIVPPEQFDPVAESYRRMNFVLNLNPVPWDLVARDANVIMGRFEHADPAEAALYIQDVDRALAAAHAEGAGPAQRIAAARKVFELCTTAVAESLVHDLIDAGAALGDYVSARYAIDSARQLWASFEHEVRATDPQAYFEIGVAWLDLASSLGSPVVVASGPMPPDRETFDRASAKIVAYVEQNFGAEFSADFIVKNGRDLAPLPSASATFDAAARVPVKLPPGHDINKQLPRPRQVLNMAEHDVDEHDTTLIALGDMVFDSPYIFGDPARSLGMSCNTCHNKSITNPGFFIPGLSSESGGMDVSNSFFFPAANNAHFDPLDIPDLRGIRFTAPYGRNGRFASLREFVRNVVVNEFAGAEPSPLMLDAMIAYMNEFDFLPNPTLNADGTLNESAGDSAIRGEILFNRNFERMGNRSCATCHIPSANFVDRRQHDIGTVGGTGPGSRDRTLDTPTLLSSAFSGPYFHDGSQPTLGSVVEWFDGHYALELGEGGIADLTAYLETVGDGVDGYEDTIYTLDAEMEEFSFFLSAYEFLRDRGDGDLLGTTFQTVALEIHAHKWDVQDERYLPVLNELAGLMEAAYEANLRGDAEAVEKSVTQYRKLYEENADVLI